MKLRIEKIMKDKETNKQIKTETNETNEKQKAKQRKKKRKINKPTQSQQKTKATRVSLSLCLPPPRFTSKGDLVYGIALSWPSDNLMTLGSVLSTPHTHITMLGYNENHLTRRLKVR